MGKSGVIIKDSLVAEYMWRHFYVTKFTKTYRGLHINPGWLGEAGLVHTTFSILQGIIILCVCVLVQVTMYGL